MVTLSYRRDDGQMSIIERAIETSINGICFVRPDGTIFSANRSFIRMWGFGGLEEVLGFHISGLYPDYEMFVNEYRKFEENGSYEGEIEALRRDGSIFYVELSASQALDDQGNVSCLMYSFIDVTQRRNLDQALRDSETTLRLIAENIEEVFWMSDPEISQMFYVSPSYEKLWGRSCEGLYESPKSFIDATHPDDLDRLLAELKRHSDGHWDIEYRIVRPDGAVRWIHDRGFPIRDENGRLQFMTGVARDVTAMKAAQESLIKANEELERRVLERTEQLETLNRDLLNEIQQRRDRERLLRQKTQELEQFAYVASHDLREPLRMMSGFAKLLEDRYRGRLDEKADKYIYYIVDGAIRMEKLIDGLLTYSRLGRDAMVREKTSVRTAVEQCISDLQKLLAESEAEITYDELPTITVNPVQFEQLIRNLIQNAVKFRREEKPRIHISAVRRCDCWEFSVSDNGIGIDPEQHDRIFGIFQQLHSREKYGGTGLGLAIAKKVVESHGGRIWLESKPGTGSVFHFTIADR